MPMETCVRTAVARHGYLVTFTTRYDVSIRLSIFVFLGAAGSGKQRLGQQHRSDTVRKQRGEEEDQPTACCNRVLTRLSPRRHTQPRERRPHGLCPVEPLLELSAQRAAPLAVQVLLLPRANELNHRASELRVRATGQLLPAADELEPVDRNGEHDARPLVRALAANEVDGEGYATVPHADERCVRLLLFPALFPSWRCSLHLGAAGRAVGLIPERARRARVAVAMAARQAEGASKGSSVADGTTGGRRRHLRTRVPALGRRRRSAPSAELREN